MDSIIRKIHYLVVYYRVVMLKLYSSNISIKQSSPLKRGNILTFKTGRKQIVLAWKKVKWIVKMDSKKRGIK